MQLWCTLRVTVCIFLRHRFADFKCNECRAELTAGQWIVGQIGHIIGIGRVGRGTVPVTYR